MTFEVIRGQGQGEEMTSVPYRDYFFWVIRSTLAAADGSTTSTGALTAAITPLQSAPIKKQPLGKIMSLQL